jgi:hypothetical protein
MVIHGRSRARHPGAHLRRTRSKHHVYDLCKQGVSGSSPLSSTERYSRFTGPRFTFGLGAGLLAASAASSCCKRESVHNAVGVARLTCRSFGGQRPLPQVKTKREHLTTTATC